ncbi:MAG: prepilin-type N-terminal cleavage/methylation domain-containing protein, partial [Deltaproteobacteria bacterium]|nr:prepilin-type N-terminal cleavage/methylation domain-containing protein [Deltaproteobacteria bacterium]
MRKQKPLWPQKGFTLLELLITVVILSLIVGIAGGAFRLSIRVWEKGEEKMEEFRKTRIVLDRLAQQIKSFYPYWIKEEDKYEIAFQGEANTLTFVSPISLQSPMITGLVLVQYLLEHDRNPDEGGDLILRESLLIGDDLSPVSLEESEKEGSGVTLLSGLDELTFDYYVLPPDSKEGEWLESWVWKEQEEDMMLPQAIRITLKQKPKNPETDEPLTTAMTIPLIASPLDQTGFVQGKPGAGPASSPSIFPPKSRRPPKL